MALKQSAQKVQDRLVDLGYDNQVIELPDSTRTAEEAAAAVGCSVGQIAKSLIFRGKSSDRSVLVMAAGTNRVDEKRIGAILGEKIGRADADFVREKTGFAIGGVPPLAHADAPVVFLDRDLFEFETIWAAAGTPFSVFQLTPDELEQITGGDVTDIRA